MSDLGLQVILETYSDHIYNGLRKNIKKRTILLEKTAVYFLELDQTMQTKVYKIKLNEQGAEENTFRAGVLSRTRSEVTIKMRDGSPVQMSCSCPVPKSGRNCEHMAAVLYAIEMLNNPGEQDPAEKEAATEQRRDEETLEKKMGSAGRKKQ